MMTDEDVMIRDTARRFAREKLAPFGREWDKTGEFPPQLLTEMGALGLFGLLLPEAYGGSNAGYFKHMLAVEEIAAGNGGISTLMHVHALGAASTLAALGNDAQKAEWLPPMIAGEAIGAISLSEPEAGSDVAAIGTRATRVDGGWRLDGVKQFVSNGARAKVVIVLAVTEPGAGSRSMSFFLVPAGTPGLIVARREEKLGQATSDTAQIILDNCRVGDGAVLGPLHHALPLTMGLLSDGRVSVAAQAIGMARAAYDCALAYAKERKAFGKPIFEHQALAFRLADMAMSIDVARAHMLGVARMLDAKQECAKEASMTKLFACQMAERVCSDAIQIHGGYGYLKDFPVERIYRDVRVCQIYEGTNDIQRLIIARKIAGEGA